MVRLLAALNANTTMDGLLDVERNIEISFAEPMLTSLPGRVDAVTKLSSVIEGFGSTTVGMRMAGMDDADIAQVRSEVMQMQAMQAAQAAFANVSARLGQSVEVESKVEEAAPEADNEDR